MNEEKLFKGRVVAPMNVMKIDIAYRIFQCNNLESLVYSDLMQGRSDLVQDFFAFVETFRGLWNATDQMVKKKNKEEYEKFRQFFDWLLAEVTRIREFEEGSFIEELYKTAQKVLDAYRRYREILMSIGLLNLATYEIRPEYAYRESL